MLYQIKGATVISNFIVSETIEAPNPRAALRKVLKLYGRLRRGYEVYTESFLNSIDYPEAERTALIEPLLCDHFVFKIGHAIRNGTVTQDEYRLFCRYFHPMISNAVNMFWNDVFEIPASDIKTEMIGRIACEFLPRVDDRGHLRPFIKGNIQSRLIKMWNRKKYVNENKANSRAQLQQEYAMASHIRPETPDTEVSRNAIIRIALHLRETRQELTRKQKKEYYQLIINLGMHKECLKSEYQIQALENCYGRDAITEKEFGTERGRSQSTIHITKRRAEDNIIKYICENFGD